MEVHAHSHTARKKWTHYFWEFFMLFLAVTLGFFVENQREHLVEHKREKQYIHSMIEDLNADTTKLATIINDHTNVILGLDSVQAHYGVFAAGQYSPVFIKYERALNGFTDFIYTDRTINQLKSSGGMRLIRKQAASDSIIIYDDEVRDFLLEQAGLQRIFDQMSDELIRTFNYRLFKEEFKNPEKMFTNKNLDLLLTHDKQKIETFYNLINTYKETLKSKRNEARSLKQKATRLVAFLKSQYHFH